MSFTSMERKAKRLRIYIGESDQWQGKPLYNVLLKHLREEGLAGATVFRGLAGFGAHSRIHTAAVLRLSEDLPLVVEVVDSPDKIQRAAESISVMVREGLVTVEDVEVLVYSHRELHPLPADKTVEEVMTRDPAKVGSDETALVAWERMLRSGLKSLPVVDSSGVVVGLLTHEDLLERAGLHARLAVAQRLDEESLRNEFAILKKANLTVGQVMSTPPITIRPEDSLGLAADRMVKEGITRLPVVDPPGRLVGIISRLDLLRQIIDLPTHSAVMPQFQGRLAGEVMTLVEPVVLAEAGLEEILAAFVTRGEHRVVVVDDAGRPLGVISDSDVIGRVQPANRRGILGALGGRSQPPALDISARELMSPGAETVGMDVPLVEVVQRMVSTRRKWFTVVDTDGRAVGLIDRETALRALV